MNLVKLSASYLRARALNTTLQVVLFALGIGTITLLLLATTQLDQRMRRDAEGIDLVIGAKGSPLQIILSAIYHLDVPTGNIAYKQAKEIAVKRGELWRLRICRLFLWLNLLAVSGFLLLVLV